jgi:CHAT domain-containing protein
MRAVDMARANADVREEARSLSNLAVVHIYLGKMAQAAREYESLLPLMDQKNQPYQYGVVLGNYGRALIGLGDFDRALDMHTRALAIYTRLGEEDERAIELSALGSLYFRMGDAHRALETFRAAIVEQERLSDAQGLAGTLRLAGNAASALGDHKASLEFLRRSTRIDANPHSVARTRVLIAGELRSIGELAAAELELAGPLASANTIVLADALEERARLRLARKDAPRAIEDLRTADSHYAALGLELNRVDTHTALSRALLDTGDARGAGVAADEAIAIVSRIRVKSANPEWRARFLSARYSPYEARIAADFAAPEAAGAAWRAFRTAEDVRARSLADEIAVSGDGTLRIADPEESALRTRLTSLQSRLESNVQRQAVEESGAFSVRRAIEETRAQLDTLRARHGIAAGQSLLPDSLARVQGELPADTAVLAYFVGDEQGYAWLLTRSKLSYARLPDRVVLEKTILSAQREERGGTAVGKASRALGAMLFQQLLEGVGEHRLLLLADGPLNSVAFAALPVPGADELLVDRFVIANAPSLALALSKPAHARSRNSRVAVVFEPVYAPDDRRLTLAMRDVGANLRGPATPSPNNLTRLPFSALEADSVTRAFGAESTIQLSGFDATPSRVLALPAKDLAVLHFATHAVAHNDSPDQSALFLTEYARDGALLPASRLTTSDIVRSGLRADVVVLSGCATGDGGALRGEGVLGLTYGFLANGSHSVVASLWPIEDAATARLMNEFYRAYRESRSAADALRTAQLRTRASAPAGVWSSFVVRANEFP